MLGIGTPKSKRWLVPIPAYLITHPTAGPILVDTAFHASVAAKPAANLGRIAARFARPRIEPGRDIPAQLRERGIDEDEIATVVMTHLHFDHASGIAEYPSATFVLSKAEWEAATTDPRPFLRGYRPAHYDYLFDYRTIDFDGPGIASYASFGRSFDLLGDGSIRIAYTPGHSAGHCSVIAHLRDRDLVIAGDAIYTQAQLEGGAAAAAPARHAPLAALAARAAAVRPHLPARRDPSRARPGALEDGREALRVAAARSSPWPRERA